MVLQLCLTLLCLLISTEGHSVYERIRRNDESTSISSASCKDTYPQCPDWKKTGMCEMAQYKDYMPVVCTDTCGYCKSKARSEISSPTIVDATEIGSSKSSDKDIIDTRSKIKSPEGHSKASRTGIPKESNVINSVEESVGGARLKSNIEHVKTKGKTDTIKQIISHPSHSKKHKINHSSHAEEKDAKSKMIEKKNKMLVAESNEFNNGIPKSKIRKSGSQKSPKKQSSAWAHKLSTSKILSDAAAIQTQSASPASKDQGKVANTAATQTQSAQPVSSKVAKVETTATQAQYTQPAPSNNVENSATTQAQSTQPVSSGEGEVANTAATQTPSTQQEPSDEEEDEEEEDAATPQASTTKQVTSNVKGAQNTVAGEHIAEPQNKMSSKAKEAKDSAAALERITNKALSNDTEETEMSGEESGQGENQPEPSEELSGIPKNKDSISYGHQMVNTGATAATTNGKANEKSDDEKDEEEDTGVADEVIDNVSSGEPKAELGQPDLDDFPDGSDSSDDEVDDADDEEEEEEEGEENKGDIKDVQVSDLQKVSQEKAKQSENTEGSNNTETNPWKTESTNSSKEEGKISMVLIQNFNPTFLKKDSPNYQMIAGNVKKDIQEKIKDADVHDISFSEAVIEGNPRQSGKTRVSFNLGSSNKKWMSDLLKLVDSGDINGLRVIKGSLEMDEE